MDIPRKRGTDKASDACFHYRSRGREGRKEWASKRICDCSLVEYVVDEMVWEREDESRKQGGGVEGNSASGMNA